MKNLNCLKDLKEYNIIIYGAGITGHAVFTLLTQKAGITNIIAFCDMYKIGVDEFTGINIIKPKALYNYENFIIIIGISDFLKIDVVEEVEDMLKRFGITSDDIVRYNTFLSMFNEYSSKDFDWQGFSDDVYNFNTNSLLIENLSKNISVYDKSVVDLGAGGMGLRKYLLPDVSYYPVDFKSRCNETIVCDFNKYQFPNVKADVYVLCAMLYYIDDPKWLIEKCASFSSRKIIIALHNKRLDSLPEVMKTSGLRNYLYFDEIEEILYPYGFSAYSDIVIESISRRYVTYTKNCEM